MGPNSGPLLDAARATQDQQRSSADRPAMKTEYDEDTANSGGCNQSQSTTMTQLTQQTQPPSPLYSMSPGADADAYTDLNGASFAANSSLPRPEDDDVPMTDATDSTTTATATTAIERMPFKPERSPSAPASAAVTQAKKPRTAGPRSRGGGAAKGRGGSSSASRGGISNGRGGSRGGGGGSSSGRKSRGRGGVRKSAALSNGRSSKAGIAASPAPTIKREADTTPSFTSGDDESSASEDAEDGQAADGEEEQEQEQDEPDEDASSDNGPYCICRGPDDHRWMIQCDQCEDWFHGDCVNIDKELGESVILSYICPGCTIPERYITRFRKLCSLPSCRKPCRLYAEDKVSPASPDVASYFCSDGHRDQWWETLLARVTRLSNGGAAVPEDKMPVDHVTSAQLVSILASANQEGVAQMLLHGLTQDRNVDPESLLTEEERAVTQKSAAHRYRLAEQFVMCKKMLELLDMAKTRNYDAIKAGLIERDCCGYDDRLEHIGVQPHFEHFLASPEGSSIFRAGRLAAPLARPDDDNNNNGGGGDDRAAMAASDSPADYEAATAGMCRKRKCKAHLGWFSTLARDVRMQIQDLTREAAAQRDNETRIQRAAMQRTFIKRHMKSEVLFVGDSDNSLSSLGGDSGGSDMSDSDATDEDDNDDDDDDDDDNDNDSSNHRQLARQSGPSASASPPPYDAYPVSYRSSADRDAPAHRNASQDSIGAYSD